MTWADRPPDWPAIVAALENAERVGLACHVKPDGDALGALLGASLGLAKLGIESHPSWDGNPVKLPPPYDWLPGAHLLEQVDEVPETPTFVAIDCGAADRLGRLQPVARRADCLINIDHHPGNEDFGDLNAVVTTASSSAELVARLLVDLGVDIDADIATCLYVGIVTDTGRFQYTNSSSGTLRMAADLLDRGAQAPEIAKSIFESQSFGYLKLVGRVLERASLFPAERFVYSWLSRADLEDTGVGVVETDGLIDAVRSTRAADVAAIFKEQPDGRWRVSLRSKGPSVGAVARARGGGGHELAAGFTSDDVESTVADIRSRLARQSASAHSRGSSAS
jgi:bifunctional oligoribonuclease and PAP phosphatase NrnA